MKTQFLIFSILLMSLTFCNKEDAANSALFQTWEVKDFMSLESKAYPKNENNKILLTFNKSGTYNLKLDINNCNGRFITSKDKHISMASTACTKVCCDSEFSEKLTATLPKVKTYIIDGNMLRLEVPEWGFIKLELVSN